MPIRWQDWTDVLLGFWLVFSPWKLGYTLDTTATANAHGLGLVLIIFNILSATRLVDEWQEIVNILLGVWLILSPYTLNFANDTEPSINAMWVGSIIVALAVGQIYGATRNNTD